MNIERLKELAGVNQFKGYTEYTLENMSKAICLAHFPETPDFPERTDDPLAEGGRGRNR